MLRAEWILLLSVATCAAYLARGDALDEPYGTLILTLSVTAIEVASISTVMMHGENNPALVRNTRLAVIMIILNGMVGLSLLFAGWLHREQHYNLQNATLSQRDHSTRSVDDDSAELHPLDARFHAGV